MSPEELFRMNLNKKLRELESRIKEADVKLKKAEKDISDLKKK